MQQAVKSNKNYFKDVANAFTGNPVTNTMFKVSRKNAFVALANLSDAFSRMMAEPKSKQKNIRQLHQFVVLNHILTSHIATLSSYVMPLSAKYASADFTELVNNTVLKLDDAERMIDAAPAVIAEESLPQNNIQQRLLHLLETRRGELKEGIIDSETKNQLTEFKPLADQFNFIENVAADIKKNRQSMGEGIGGNDGTIC
jgi:uncharacterized membrane protein YccC